MIVSNECTPTENHSDQKLEKISKKMYDTPALIDLSSLIIRSGTIDHVLESEAGALGS